MEVGIGCEVAKVIGGGIDVAEGGVDVVDGSVDVVNVVCDTLRKTGIIVLTKDPVMGGCTGGVLVVVVLCSAVLDASNMLLDSSDHVARFAPVELATLSG